MPRGARGGEFSKIQLKCILHCARQKGGENELLCSEPFYNPAHEKLAVLLALLVGQHIMGFT